MKNVTIHSTGYEHILTWEKDLKNSNLVYNTFNKVLAQSLLSFDNPSLEKLLETLKTLPNESFWRILTSPDFYQRLIEASKGNLEGLVIFLQDSILVEEIRFGKKINLQQSKWSANGDLFVPPDELNEINPDWDFNHQYHSELLNDQLPLDFGSIHARRDMPVESFRPIKYGDAIPFSKEEKKITEEKVNNAFKKIAICTPIAAQFVLNYAKTIVLRKDFTNPKTFQSSSCNGYIGQIVLLNPHLSHVDEAYISESIIHESIHSLMWRAEVLSQIIKDPQKEMGTVISPWTGAELHYYTILQACFVWYGIANFWRMNLNSDLFPKLRTKYLYERAIKGFEKQNFMNQVRKYSDNLSEGMFDCFIRLGHEADNKFYA